VHVIVPPPMEVIVPAGQGVTQAELKQSVVGGGQVAPAAQAANKVKNFTFLCKILI
jgi:hypothetical protein